MAEASVSVDRDQFSCPVCLDLLKDPVTINCGHSYCMGCIKGCWDQEAQRGVYSCPKCRQTFRSRPVLGRNNILAEMVEKLRETVASLDQNSPAGPTDVACDVCTAPKFKAVKSCLVCLASYCGTHLRLHSELNPGNRHKVIDNPDQMKKRICPYHNKPLNEFCCTDQKFICRMCVLDYHRGHDVLPVEAERAQKQGQIGTIQTQYRQRVLEREKKLRQLKQGIQSLKVSAQATVNEYEKMFTELVSSLKKKSSELTELIRSRERAELERTEGILKRLEKEIAELKRRDTELWQLSQCDDDWLFLQNFPSLSTLPGSEHFPNITVNLPSFGDTRKSVSELKKQVEALCRKECDKVSLQDFHQLTVDTNSAYEYLGLTEEPGPTSTPLSVSALAFGFLTAQT
ncbi:E3 ubiquitin-protein ligase TRIM47-like [Chanos chanos]|uniref:E3 ubiquitin-protein ligase TRIM47-like n=1 Tax=Chanos chanos TaxID=29144 RepID=A0A6J2WJ63_CHACN|nr:E3 ubiquitin-protein ligase TRIM47-like [Chanos chanos]